MSDWWMMGMMGSIASAAGTAASAVGGAAAGAASAIGSAAGSLLGGGAGGAAGAAPTLTAGLPTAGGLASATPGVAAAAAPAAAAPSASVLGLGGGGGAGTGAGGIGGLVGPGGTGAGTGAGIGPMAPSTPAPLLSELTTADPMLGAQAGMAPTTPYAPTTAGGSPPLASNFQSTLRHLLEAKQRYTDPLNPNGPLGTWTSQISPANKELLRYALNRKRTRDDHLSVIGNLGGRFLS